MLYYSIIYKCHMPCIHHFQIFVWKDQWYSTLMFYLVCWCSFLSPAWCWMRETGVICLVLNGAVLITWINMLETTIGIYKWSRAVPATQYSIYACCHGNHDFVNLLKVFHVYLSCRLYIILALWMLMLTPLTCSIIQLQSPQQDWL